MAKPLISIIIPTYNEEANIARCLRSIFFQNYPQDKLEVLVIDNNSTDKTVELAKQFPVAIIPNEIRHPENSKMKGFRLARGEYFLYLDADIELIGNDWLDKMLLPFEKEPDLIGSFTRYKPNDRMTPLNQYLSYEELQRDSLLKFFSPTIASTIIQQKDEYALCQYSPEKIPPQSVNLYKKEFLDKIFDEKDQYFWDLDVLYLLVQKGYNKFAYVENAGLYHYHVKNLKHLVQKRVRNLTQVHQHAQRKVLYQWINFTNVKDLIKMFIWVLGANIFLPGIIIALCKNLKHRRLIFFYEPFVNLAVTNSLLVLFLITLIKKRRRLGAKSS